MADVDERLLEFLSTIEPAVAELVLQEAKVLDFTGVQNRPAYLMGVCKRKVDGSDPYPYPYPKT